MKTDIRYIVKIKPEYISEFKDTIIESGRFAGISIIEGQEKCVFQILPSETMIVIPYDYILWVAPVKKDIRNYENGKDLTI